MTMPIIPKHMNNEESKLIAGVVVTHRDNEIAQAKHNAARTRLHRYKIKKLIEEGPF